MELLLGTITLFGWIILENLRIAFAKDMVYDIILTEMYMMGIGMFRYIYLFIFAINITRVFKSNWHENKREGQGKFTWNNGTKYDG